MTIFLQNYFGHFYCSIFVKFTVLVSTNACICKTSRYRTSSITHSNVHFLLFEINMPPSKPLLISNVFCLYVLLFIDIIQIEFILGRLFIWHFSVSTMNLRFTHVVASNSVFVSF